MKKIILFVVLLLFLSACESDPGLCELRENGKVVEKIYIPETNGDTGGGIGFSGDKVVYVMPQSFHESAKYILVVELDDDFQEIKVSKDVFYSYDRDEYVFWEVCESGRTRIQENVK